MLTLLSFCCNLSLLFCPSCQETNDILLLDFSADVDCNQNNIKGTASVTSCTLNHGTDNTFSEKCDYFPTPDSDPFRDDPLSKSPAQNSSKYSMDSGSCSNITAGSVSNTVINNVVTADSELSSKTIIVAVRHLDWPLSDKESDDSTNTIIGGNYLESPLSSSNPFFENSLKNSLVLNNLSHKNSLCTKPHSTQSVLISPPPQNSKAGRRRSTKVKLFVKTIYHAAWFMHYKL